LSELERAVPGANGIRYLNTNTGHYLSLKYVDYIQILVFI